MYCPVYLCSAAENQIKSKHHLWTDKNFHFLHPKWQQVLIIFQLLATITNAKIFLILLTYIGIVVSRICGLKTHYLKLLSALTIKYIFFAWRLIQKYHVHVVKIRSIWSPD